MKKTLLTNLKFIAIGLVIAISASYAYAAWGGLTNTFENNTSTPPAGNTDTPLHTGTADQVKPVGSCTAGNCGGLALGGTFLASRSAEFDGTTFLKGIVGGGSDGSFPASSMLYFGFSGNPTPITVSGALTTNSSLKSTLLANSDGTKTVCSDENGVVSFCNPVDMCTNIAGNQDAVPTGYQQNPDGTCSKASKRFLSITQYASYNSDDYGILVGNVSGGNLPPYKAPNTPNNALPWVVQAGLYNGPSDCPISHCPQWIYNDIPGVQPTDFTGGKTRLITVGESGTYHIVINTSGQIGMKGKFRGSTGQLATDLSLKINNTWYDFGPSTGRLHEAYPNPSHTKSEFDSSQTSGYTGNTGGGGALDPFFSSGGGNGDQFHYIPFSANLDKTIHLNKGDTVDVTADIYGWSSYEVKPTEIDYTNWNYSIETNGATFDITETPDN